jgi:hypothetical protein
MSTGKESPNGLASAADRPRATLWTARTVGTREREKSQRQGGRLNALLGGQRRAATDGRHTTTGQRSSTLEARKSTARITVRGPCNRH